MEPVEPALNLSRLADGKLVPLSAGEGVGFDFECVDALSYAFADLADFVCVSVNVYFFRESLLYAFFGGDHASQFVFGEFFRPVFSVVCHVFEKK